MLFHPVREEFLKKVRFAVHTGGWLCLLPLLLRAYTLPALLQRLTKVRGRQKKRSALGMDQAVGIVVWICRLPVFRLPIFPQACLRQALTLYHVLTGMGYPVEIHFGIQKEGEKLQGHSWVTIQGKPVAERQQVELFRPLYSYPPGSIR